MSLSFDLFRCPHEGCMVVITEDCLPHSEFLGSESRAVGDHCWKTHKCVFDHHLEAWTHVEVLR